MAKARALAESLRSKSLFIAITTPGLKEGLPFNINLGLNEVIILKALHFWWSGTGVLGTNSVILGLWRKTDTDPPDSLLGTASDDLLWSEQGQFQMPAALESIWTSDHGGEEFPEPHFFLIRAPRLIARTVAITGVVIQVRLYYTIRKVSERDMAELMMKDHA